MRTKRRMPALLVAVTAALALSGGIGASSAMAEALPGHCEGVEISGQGSTLQKLAQELWTGVAGGNGFNKNAAGCTAPNKEPKVKYTATGSGAGLEAWGVKKAGNKPGASGDAYIATDQAPTLAELEEIDKEAGAVEEAGKFKGQAVVIPVAQEAVAIIVDPPTGCSLTQISNADLEKVWNGTIKEWSGITGVTGGSACNVAIERIVRKDKSGTTYQFKHYLFEINKVKNLEVGGVLKTWAELQASAENKTWPHGGTLSVVKEATNEGGSGVAEQVAKTEGTIGYAALSDARKAALEHNYTWVAVQNESGGGIPEYPYPGTSAGEPSMTVGNSNCEKSTYNGVEGIPVEPDQNWSKVYGGHPKGNEHYPICTLTWDIGLESYNLASYPTPGKVAQTAGDYLEYVAAKTGGQADFATHDYLLVEEVVGEYAEKAAKLIASGD